MVVLVQNSQTVKLSTTALKQTLASILKHCGFTDWDLHCSLVTPRAIKRHNFKFRNLDEVQAVRPGVLPIPLTPEHQNLGHLILCPRYIMDHTTNLEKRMRRVCIHGVCHLIGYDHETEEEYQLMRARERALSVKIKREIKISELLAMC